MTVAELEVKIMGRLDDLDRKLNDAKSKSKKKGGEAGSEYAKEFKKKLADDMRDIGRTIGVGMGLLSAGVALGLKKAVDAASELNEQASASAVTFGKSADIVKRFADRQAAAFAISREEAHRYASSLGGIFKASGLTTEASAKMSVAVEKLAGDMASFKNLRVDDALEKLRSGLVGEVEPLRSVGVLLSENAVKAEAMRLKFKFVGGELSEGQKVMARYSLIMKQTVDAQGDMARTSDSVANQERLLQTDVKNLAAAFGQDLLPAAKDLLVIARDLVKGFVNLDDGQRQNLIRIGLVAAALGPGAALAGGLVRTIKLVSDLAKMWGLVGTASTAAAGAQTAAGGATAGKLAGLLPWLGKLGVPAAVATFGAWQMDKFNKEVQKPDYNRRVQENWMRGYGDRDDPASFANPSGKAAGSISEIAKKAIAAAMAIGAYGFREDNSIKITDPGNNLPGKPGKAKKEKVEELTTAMIESMFSQVKTPGSKAYAACADAASKFIAMFTHGITDQGGSPTANAGALIEKLRKLGAMEVAASDAKIGALAYRRGSGPSGWHVGVYSGEEVLDVNGQRDGRRNTKGRSSPKGWKFLNIPREYMDFGEGQVGEGMRELLRQMEEAAKAYADAMEEATQRTVDLAKAKALLNARTEEERTRVEQSFRKGGKGYLQAVGSASGLSYDALDDRNNRTELYISQQRDMAERIKQLDKDWTMLGGQIVPKDWLHRAMAVSIRESNTRKELVERSKQLDKDWAIFGGQIVPRDWLTRGFVESVKQSEELQEQATGRFEDSMKNLAERVSLLGSSTDAYNFKLKALAINFGVGKTEAERMASGMDKARQVMDETLRVEKLEAQRQELQRMATTVEEAFMAMFDNLAQQGFGGFFNNVIAGFRDMLAQMAREWIASQIRQGLQNVLGGLIGGLFGGGGGRGQSLGHGLFKAQGGPVRQGLSYIVGERGPELFVPNSGGNIVPNHQLAAAGGQVVNVHMTVVTPDARSFESDTQIVQRAGNKIGRVLKQYG